VTLRSGVPAGSRHPARVACLGLLGGLTFLASPGCGTAAKGVQDCRDIEQARCKAAVACGIVTHETDCEIYYRDHCLHGLPVTPPQPAQVDDCVATITTLGTCVQSFGKDALLADCNPERPLADNATSACEVVQYPERAYACSFLTGTETTPPDSSAGAGNAGNTETSSAGQGGQGGAE
jgi:hypothetical protein